MIEELFKIALVCDGVRCDMCMLVMPAVFEKTWGNPTNEPIPSFWKEAITAITTEYRDFIFLGEVYWDMEWELQQEGFHFTYDKRLYDRVLSKDVSSIRDHICGASKSKSFFEKGIKFLGNHDEVRVASVLSVEEEKAAAVLMYTLPGMHYFFDGQWEGRKVKTSVHLGRRPQEPINEELVHFYGLLCDVLKRETIYGDFTIRPVKAAWDENKTFNNFFTWTYTNEQNDWLLIVINYSKDQGQCYVSLFEPGEENTSCLNLLDKRDIVFNDLMANFEYTYTVNSLKEKGLYLDLAPWAFHVFRIS